MKRFLPLLLLLLTLLPLSAQESRPPNAPDDIYWDSRFGEGNGLGGENYSGVNALARVGNYLYAGGTFLRAGELLANNIARFDGSAWSPLVGAGGAGVNRGVLAMARMEDDLYVGGFFDSAGGIHTGPVARWDGSRWHSLGAPIAGQISALLVVEGELYAGGSFHLNGGTTHATFARWTGTEWQMLGKSPNGPVFALAQRGNNIYVGGTFDTVAGLRTGPVAQWSFRSLEWLPLGEELRDTLSHMATVYAIEVIDGEVYAGGKFNRAGDKDMAHIARLDSFLWEPLGGGVTEGFEALVFSIEGSSRKIYVGGTFGKAGGRGAGHIAQWDRMTEQWDSLGSGVQHCQGFECLTSVSALLAEGSELFVGGTFTVAGEKPSLLIGRWTGETAHVTPREPAVIAGSLALSPSPSTGAVSIDFTLSRHSLVEISIVDIQGKRVAAAIDPRTFTPGTHTISYDASHLPAGTYFCRLVAGDVTTVAKLVRK